MLREPKGLIAPDASKKPLCLGGFVIHGNSAGTLGRCLDALVAVCDEVVAVDSESRDGSCELCRERGVNSIVQSWQGYGRARAVAAAALAHCDYIFFLDADEWLEPEAFGAFSRWRASAPALPHYTVRRRDWAELANGRRFLYRVETRARLVRRDCAVWQPSWIVHEALPRRASAPLGIFVEHAFADSVAALADKQAIYAFLWALRAHSEKKRSRSAFGRALASTLRDAVLKGALWRGGRDGWLLARAVSRYHRLKYDYLQALENGAFPEATSAYAAGRYGEVFALARHGAPALL